MIVVMPNALGLEAPNEFRFSLRVVVAALAVYHQLVDAPLSVQH
jgi:hypothetical protein